MVGVPGFLARFLTRFWARFLTRVFGQGFWDRKYSFTVLPGQKNTVLQYHRDGENLEKNHVIKNPILLKIPYIKNLAVPGVKSTQFLTRVFGQGFWDRKYSFTVLPGRSVFSL